MPDDPYHLYNMQVVRDEGRAQGYRYVQMYPNKILA